MPGTPTLHYYPAHIRSSRAIHTAIFNSPPRSHTGVVSRCCTQKGAEGLDGEGRNTHHSRLRTPHSVHRKLRYHQGCIWGKGYSPSGTIYVCTYLQTYITLATSHLPWNLSVNPFVNCLDHFASTPTCCMKPQLCPLVKKLLTVIGSMARDLMNPKMHKLQYGVLCRM